MSLRIAVTVATVAGITTAAPLQQATTPGCGLSPPASGWHNLMVPDPLAGNTQRWIRLHVPTNYDPQTPAALIIDIHGYSSSADEQEERTGLRALANQQNFIVAVRVTCIPLQP